MRKLLKALLTAAILFAGFHAHAGFIANESGERYGFQGAYGLPTSAGTVAFWVNPTWASTDGVNHTFIFADTQATTCGNDLFGIQKFSDNKIYAGWFTGGVDHRVVVNSGSFTLNQNAWNLFAFTYDDTANTNALYLNGTQIGTQNSTLVTWTITGNFFMGSARCTNGVNNPNAGFAEVAVWSRVLATGELSALAKKYAPLFFRSGLDFYVPGIRNDSGTDFVFNPRYKHASGGGVTLTGVTGFTNTLQAHPPIFYPRGMQ